MSYQTYTTDAIVCGSFDRLTADKSYLLFTEVAGMVLASARSVREERSKQRFALQDFSRIRVSLVKGKHGWRIGSVEPTNNYYRDAADRAARGTVVSVIQLIRRFVTGEESHQDLYADTIHILAAAVTNHIPQAQLYDMYTLRLLAKLGYIAPHASYQTWLESPDWYENPESLPVSATKAIQAGLAVSHL